MRHRRNGSHPTRRKRDEYVRDPLCSYTFTLGAYYQMFAGMKVLVRKGSMKRIPKTLPVLFYGRIR